MDRNEGNDLRSDRVDGRYGVRRQGIGLQH